MDYYVIFIFVFGTTAIYSLLRVLFHCILKNALKNLFDGDVSFKSGDNFLSIRDLKIKNEFGEISCENLRYLRYPRDKVIINGLKTTFSSYYLAEKFQTAKSSIASFAMVPVRLSLIFKDLEVDNNSLKLSSEYLNIKYNQSLLYICSKKFSCKHGIINLSLPEFKFTLHYFTDFPKSLHLIRPSFNINFEKQYVKMCSTLIRGYSKDSPVWAVKLCPMNISISFDEEFIKFPECTLALVFHDVFSIIFSNSKILLSAKKVTATSDDGLINFQMINATYEDLTLSSELFELSFQETYTYLVWKVIILLERSTIGTLRATLICPNHKHIMIDMQNTTYKANLLECARISLYMYVENMIYTQININSFKWESAVGVRFLSNFFDPYAEPCLSESEFIALNEIYIISVDNEAYHNTLDQTIFTYCKMVKKISLNCMLLTIKDLVFTSLDISISQKELKSSIQMIQSVFPRKFSSIDIDYLIYGEFNGHAKSLCVKDHATIDEFSVSGILYAIKSKNLHVEFCGMFNLKSFDVNITTDKLSVPTTWLINYEISQLSLSHHGNKFLFNDVDGDFKECKYKKLEFFNIQAELTDGNIVFDSNKDLLKVTSSEFTYKGCSMRNISLTTWLKDFSVDMFCCEYIKTDNGMVGSILVIDKNNKTLTFTSAELSCNFFIEECMNKDSSFTSVKIDNLKIDKNIELYDFVGDISGKKIAHAKYSFSEIGKSPKLGNVIFSLDNKDELIVKIRINKELILSDNEVFLLLSKFSTFSKFSIDFGCDNFGIQPYDEHKNIKIMFNGINIRSYTENNNLKYVMEFDSFSISHDEGLVLTLQSLSLDITQLSGVFFTFSIQTGDIKLEETMYEVESILSRIYKLFSRNENDILNQRLTFNTFEFQFGNISFKKDSFFQDKSFPIEINISERKLWSIMNITKHICTQILYLYKDLPIEQDQKQKK